MTTTQASPVASAFATARSENRAVLVGYLPAGFPSVAVAIDGIKAMLEGGTDGGVDVVEIGLPYSDPLMDGPVIQAAVEQALAAGTRPSDVIRTVEAVSSLGAPALVMTYWNPIERYGASRFAADLAAAGGAGVITPDLTPEEAGEWAAACDTHALDPVLLVAPSSTPQRLAKVCAMSRGFVYAASTMGVTGVRAVIGSRAAELVTRVRAVTDTPVAVGLGVSDAAQASEVAGYADGVIVGTAFVRCLLDVEPGAGVDALRRLAGELAAGVRRRPGQG